MDWAEKNAQAKFALDNARFTTRSGHARTNCPFCESRVGKVDRKQCLAISVRTGFYKCWRCGVTGKLDGEGFEAVADVAPVERVVMAPPEGFCEIGIEPGLTAIIYEEARAYLTGRGLTDRHVWAQAHVGATIVGKGSHRVVVPVLSPEGQWWGWVSRTWLKDVERPYMNAQGMTVGTDGHLFNHAALLRETDTPVLVVEGVLDALAYWPDAVAVLGKPTDTQEEALAAARRPVAVVLDGDAWREGWALAMKLRLAGQRAGTVRLPAGKDPDEMDRDELRAAAVRCLNE